MMAFVSRFFTPDICHQSDYLSGQAMEKRVLPMLNCPQSGYPYFCWQPKTAPSIDLSVFLLITTDHGRHSQAHLR
jgi:hypothetical protein